MWGCGGVQLPRKKILKQKTKILKQKIKSFPKKGLRIQLSDGARTRLDITAFGKGIDGEGIKVSVSKFNFC